VDSVCDGNMLTNCGRIILRCPDARLHRDGRQQPDAMTSAERHDQQQHGHQPRTASSWPRSRWAHSTSGKPRLATYHGRRMCEITTIQSTVPTQYEDEWATPRNLDNPIVLKAMITRLPPIDNFGSDLPGKLVFRRPEGWFAHYGLRAMTSNRLPGIGPGTVEIRGELGADHPSQTLALQTHGCLGFRLSCPSPIHFDVAASGNNLQPSIYCG